MFQNIPTHTTILHHDIDVAGAKPVKQPAYRANPIKRKVLFVSQSSSICLNTVLKCENTKACLDDVVVFTGTWEKHLKVLNVVFVRLSKAHLTLNLAKYEFGLSTVTYLGKMVGHGHVCPVQAKVPAMINFSVPTTCRELRCFLAGYYREFCPNFLTVVAPLNLLLSPSKAFCGLMHGVISIVYISIV